MRDHFPAAQQDGASLRGPFADRVPLIVKVAAHFQQATRRLEHPHRFKEARIKLAHLHTVQQERLRSAAS